MTRHRRRDAVLLLLAASAALPGCFFTRTCIPLDARGMERPLEWFAEDFDSQVEHTSALIADLPGDFSDHCRDRWRDLTTYPGE